MPNHHNDVKPSHAAGTDSRDIPVLQQQRRVRQHGVTRTQILTWQHGVGLKQEDWLAAEEPLEIRVQSPGQEAVRVSVTMRTPGHDHELAIGFLFTEGLIQSRAEIIAVAKATAIRIEKITTHV
jgi:formate dehydrogenase assembly factor FdhD